MRKRKQIRLRDYDYSKSGYYFITICAKGREQWFGAIESGTMRLNKFGKIEEISGSRSQHISKKLKQMNFQ